MSLDQPLVPSYEETTGELSEPHAFDPGQAIYSQTPEHLARLVFLSYRYSQGGIGIQSRLLLHIRDQYQPGMFEEPLVQEVKQTTRKLVTAYFMNHTAHPPLPYTWEDTLPDNGERSPANAFDDVEGVFERVLGATDDEVYAHDILSITRGLVSMDLSYLSRKNGRADVNDKPSNDTKAYPKDPFESQFISYSILGRSAMSPEYNQVFSQVGADSTIQQLDEQTWYELQQILAIYTREHPTMLPNERLNSLKDLLNNLSPDN